MKVYTLRQAMNLKIKNFTSYYAFMSAVKQGLIVAEQSKAKNKHFIIAETELQKLKDMELLTPHEVYQMDIYGLKHHYTIRDRIADGTIKAITIENGKKTKKILIPKSEVLRFDKEYNKPKL